MYIAQKLTDMTKTKTLLFFLFISIFSFSQDYKPLDTTDYKHRSFLYNTYDDDFYAVRKQIKKDYMGKIERAMISSYTRKHERFLHNLKNKEFVFNPVFTKYIDSLTKALVDANPSLKAEHLKVHIGRYNAPNAYSMGEGIVVLNMGLFKYLENESQLVSVLSHEIAHQKLKHSANNILYKAKLLNSKEVKNKAKRIRKQKYNQYEKAFSVLKDMLYVNSKMHRSQEAQADKLGYKMYKKTKFNKTAFVNALKILSKLDSMPSIELDSTIYKKIFDLPKQAFNAEWIAKTKSKYNYFEEKAKIDRDSVASHPEIPERIEKLRNVFPELKEDVDPTASSGTYKKLQEIAKMESVTNLYYLKKYGLSTYVLLYRLSNNPENNYYKEWLGKNFKALAKAKKEYKFSRYVDNISRESQDESYQMFLKFLWSLSLDKMNNIGDYYSGE